MRSREDIGPGDITSAATIPADRMADGRFYARQDLSLAGVELLPLIFVMRGGVDELELLLRRAETGSKPISGRTVRGRARTLLECERVALNFLQRLSRCRNTGAQVYRRGRGHQMPRARYTQDDSRFSTAGETGSRGRRSDQSPHGPVRRGADQEQSHHSRRRRPRRRWNAFGSRTRRFPIEIEVRTREELDEALAAGARHVLLDNLTPKQAAAEIRYIAGRAKVELSGNITLDTIRAYAQTGADFVSSGAITHQAQAVNFNFRIELAQ